MIKVNKRTFKPDRAISPKRGERYEIVRTDANGLTLVRYTSTVEVLDVVVNNDLITVVNRRHRWVDLRGQRNQLKRVREVYRRSA